MSKKYAIIYADPPWPESSISKDKRPRRLLSDQYYKTMTAEEILGMGEAIKGLADKNCALLLWSTPRHLPLAFEVIKAWGFEFVVVGFTWMKKNKNSGTPFLGMGHYTRSNAEYCLLARKGHPRVASHRVPSALYEPKGRHSEKPETIRNRIVELFGNVPRVELFAREKMTLLGSALEGWDTWGDEVKSDIKL